MKEKILPRGLSYEDVLIRPRYSDIRSRYGDQIDTSASVARGAPRINLPIVSANMDTVTESPMATEMALRGGLGIIHRFMTSDQQADQVRRVKERMRILEEDPPMVRETATIKDVLDLLAKRKRGYVIVYAGERFSGKFSGIATTRDYLLGELETPISKVMTPNKEGVLKTVPEGTSLDEAAAFMRSNRIEKVPVVKSDGGLLGVYTLKDYSLREENPNASLDGRGRLAVGGAIGVKETDVERAHKLVDVGVDVLVLDIAHGHLIYTQEMLRRLKEEEGIKTPIIAGNVATEEGARYLKENGADGIKVGIGPGFVCETRDIAGVGVPQIAAILEVAGALGESSSIPIIADGGIRKPADPAKAIVAGASTVMIGTVLAGTDMSPGDPVEIDGQLMKSVRGMASASAFEDRQRLGDSTTDQKRYVPEGRQVLTPYKGKTSDVLRKYEGALRSSMSYVGAHNLAEMHSQGQLMRISHAGAYEQKRSLT